MTSVPVRLLPPTATMPAPAGAAGVGAPAPEGLAAAGGDPFGLASAGVWDVDSVIGRGGLRTTSRYAPGHRTHRLGSLVNSGVLRDG